ncbi:MAG: hypothetical protein ACYC35_11735 [Pirellulales bacterium]
MRASSSLGSAPGPLARRARNRWAYLGVLGIQVAAVVGLGAYILLDRRPSGPRPIVPTTLEPVGLGKLFGGGWRNLPFELAPEEDAAVRRCVELARLVRHRVNGVSKFESDSVRRELESLVAQRPRLFYAAYLLGLWHQMRGNPGSSKGYYNQALEAAPVNLVQRYEFADGRPLQGAGIDEIEIECNRVREHALDPSLKLVFFHLKTDQDGCVRLPVYNTVYRLYTAAYPAGHNADYPWLGWFEVEGKIGLMPVVVVR